ncbi:glycosyltransferase, partial [Hyphomicrobium sp.]|uniref:glycosyltransferase family 2 protein n=1 Tax=Hyphomicrobium sp. TaxID=82 RepID=UPI0025BEBB5E
ELPLTFLHHASNRGPAAARNTGLRAAGTEWVSFLDSDDHLLPQSLEARWRLVAEQHVTAPPLTAFACGWAEEDENGRVVAHRLPRAASGPRAFASGCWFSPGSCVIMNRQAILDAGIFQDERLRRLEDVDWFLDLAMRGTELRTLPLVGTVLERRRTQPPDLLERSARTIMEKWQDRTDDADLLARLSAYVDLECAAAHYYAGRWPSAAFYLARSLRAFPRLSLHFSPGWDTLT